MRNKIVNLKSQFRSQLIYQPLSPILYILLGLLVGCGILFISDFPLKLNIAVLLACLFFVLFGFVHSKTKFLLMSILLAIPFASADFFLGQQPPFHAGGAQAVPEINVVDILLLISICFLFFKGEYRKDINVRLPGFASISLLAFILWCVPSILMSDYRILGIISLFDIFKVSLLWFFIAVTLRDEKDIKFAVKMLIVGLAIQSLFGIYQAKFGYPQWAQAITQGDPTHLAEMEETSYLRVGGTIGWATIFSQYLVLLLPLCFCLFASSRKKKQTFAYGFCSLIALCSLFLTLSRQGWIAIVVGSAISTLALIYYGPSIAKKRLLVSAISVALVVIFFMPLIKARLLSPDYNSAASRLPMFKVALNVINDNPFFGSGLNSYSEVMHKYDPERLIFGFQYPVHNVYLFVCAEVGIPGFLFFILFFVSLFISLVKILRVSDEWMKTIIIGLISGLSSIFTASIVSPSFKQEVQLWYVLMAVCGIAAAVIKLERKSAKLFKY